MIPGWTPLALATVLYAWQCTEYIRINQPGMALVFFGYSLANIGFIWGLIRHAN